MLEYFAGAKKEIERTIASLMDAYGAEYASVSDDLGATAASRLASFAARGKMIRGCLVRLGYELASGREPDEASSLALNLAGAAMELFQAGLLVHDDIMDRDRTRRGAPTVHVEYEEDLRRGTYDDPQHYGEALGVCVGDLAYFAAFRVLATLGAGSNASAELARTVMAIAARELSLVGVAQMQDVVNGAVRPASTNPFRNAPTEPTEADILTLYRYKTGRYTFSLPMAIGATLAGAPELTRLNLEEAGEHLGVVFQLKDDELGLFADEAELGKPIGSDIREDKKTLFRLRLFGRVDGAERSRLGAVFGNHEASQSDVDSVLVAMERSGVRAELAALMKAEAEAASLP
ncbi:MAG: polyprenyl synthetase family protein, partial [Spirochaetales bacterium]|nr:polyprenyl synthetase family protein [Spirochaetales bacterium]